MDWVVQSDVLIRQSANLAFFRYSSKENNVPLSAVRDRTRQLHRRATFVSTLVRQRLTLGERSVFFYRDCHEYASLAKLHDERIG